MAIFKQGQLNQIVVPMVDKTDFASIESGVTSGFTCTLYTYKQGSSNPTSAITLSRVPSVVRSGIFRITMKAADTSGVDNALLKIAHASCADQYIPINFQIQATSDAVSDLQSKVVVMSDILSKLWVANTNTSDFESNMLSRIPKAVATASILSDLLSKVVIMSDILSNTYSGVTALSDVASKIRIATTGTSDFESKMLSRIPKFVATKSHLSDIVSDLRSFMTVQSDIQSKILSKVTGATSTSAIAAKVWSDYGSRTGGTPSDLYSKVTKLISRVTGPVATSSDVVSQVWGASAATVMKARMSSIDSTIDKVKSRVPKMAATASILSDFLSDFQSRVPKAVATASVLSDLNSKFISRIPKAVATASVLSDFYSDFQSRVAGTLATSDQVSDALSKISDMLSKMGGPEHIASLVWDADPALHSDALSFGSNIETFKTKIATINSRITENVTASNIASQVWGASAATVLKARESDIQSATAKLTSRITKAVANNSQLSDLHSNLKAYLVGISDILSNTRAAVLDNSAILSDFYSDFQSRVPKAVATNSQVSALAVANIASRSDLHSDLKSYLGVMSNILSNTNAHVVDLSAVVSDFFSDFQSRVPKLVATDSVLTLKVSDINSHVSGITATLTASDISDIASATAAAVGAAVASQVWANAIASDTVSKVGGLTTNLATANSQILLTKAYGSDIVSNLASIVTAGIPMTASDLSDLRSAIDAAGVNASGISDIASAVKVTLAQQFSQARSAATKAASRIVLVESMVSNVESALDSQFARTSDAISNLHGDVADISNILSNLHADVADISNVLSNLHADVAGLSDVVSNIHGDLATTYALVSDVQSKATIIQSDTSDIYSLVLDTNKGSEKFIAASGKYVKNRVDGNQMWSHVVSSNATSVVRGAGA